jgi:hypothetical protein
MFLIILPSKQASILILKFFRQEWIVIKGIVICEGEDILRKKNKKEFVKTKDLSAKFIIAKII